MSVRQLITIEPVGYKVDKKGNKIPIYRAGTRDTNKYAKRTKREQEMIDNIGNRNYKQEKVNEC